MKKIITKTLITIFFISLVFLTYFINVDFYLKDFNGSFEAYKNSSSSSAVIPLEKRQMYFFIGKCGEAVQLDKKQLKDEQLFNTLKKFEATLVFMEEIEEGKCYYAYSPKIRYEEWINGNKINLHLFVGENSVKIGTPLIYGSF